MSDQPNETTPAPVAGSEFVEAEGFIHMLNPINAEFTLCGDAFDLGSDVPGYRHEPTERRKVTCPNCARVILGCRGVRVSPNPSVGER